MKMLRVCGCGMNGERWDFRDSVDNVRDWVKKNIRLISNVFIFDNNNFKDSENNYYISRRCGWKKIDGNWIWLDYGWRWEVNGKFWKYVKV